MVMAALPSGYVVEGRHLAQRCVTRVWKPGCCTCRNANYVVIESFWLSVPDKIGSKNWKNGEEQGPACLVPVAYNSEYCSLGSGFVYSPVQVSKVTFPSNPCHW